MKKKTQTLEEKLKETLRKFSLESHNKVCFECQTPNTPYIIFIEDHAIFVCTFCAGKFIYYLKEFSKFKK
jgi:hypothetical protein